ncbi:MAG: hypothetical protein J0H52_06220 [Comamonadaceae bacterium]|jgi:hypothetical protein|nr:hypothetical protein [Comamonadaceae bacterium]
MKLTPQWILVIALASVASICSAQEKTPRIAPKKSGTPAPSAPQRLSSKEIFSRAFQALQSNDPATAADLFRAGLESDPNDENAWLYLFKAQMLLGDASGAELSKAKALSLGMPGAKFESAKSAKISIPQLPTAPFNIISLPEEVRQRIEEDPAYRLPTPPGGFDADAQSDFSILDDSGSSELGGSKEIFALGGLVYIAGYSGTYKIITKITINGELFQNKKGNKFGIKTSTITIPPPQINTALNSYIREDKIFLCEAIREIPRIKTGSIYNNLTLSTEQTNLMMYKCSTTQGKTESDLKTLDAANTNLIKSSFVTKAEYMLYIPSKKLLIRNIKEDQLHHYQ